MDWHSPEYLDIPLVLDAESLTMHTDIRAARKYEQEKEAQRIADKMKAEALPQGKLGGASIAIEPVPYDVRDVQPRCQARCGPVVDTDLPEIIIRHGSHPSRTINATNQVHRQGHGPRPVVRTMPPSRPVDHGAQPVAARTQQLEHTILTGPVRTQQTCPHQDRGGYPITTHTHAAQPQGPHRAPQVAIRALPVEARRHPDHVAGHAAIRFSLTAIPPSSFYAAIARPVATRPVLPLQHPHRVPPVCQQVVPQ